MPRGIPGEIPESWKSEKEFREYPWIRGRIPKSIPGRILKGVLERLPGDIVRRISRRIPVGIPGRIQKKGILWVGNPWKKLGRNFELKSLKNFQKERREQFLKESPEKNTKRILGRIQWEILAGIPQKKVRRNPDSNLWRNSRRNRIPRRILRVISAQNSGWIPVRISNFLKESRKKNIWSIHRRSPWSNPGRYFWKNLEQNSRLIES